MQKHWPLILVIVVSLVVHFAYFGYPKQTVFDEVHFGKFITGYFTHEYFFDIHPPLAKLLLSGMGYLSGFQPGFSFAEIGQKFTDHTYLWLRLLPTLAGALLPLVVFYLVLQLGYSRWAATTAGLLTALDNALLVQSRFILLDSFLLIFGFSALLFYFKYRSAPLTSTRIRYLLLTGISGALAVSVKWTGATFLALPIILELVRIIRYTSTSKTAWVRLVVCLGVVPLLLYFAIFTIHFQLLTKSGPGDAFMTPPFQKTLAGNHHQADPQIKPAGLVQKFIGLNFEMFRANANLTAGHPYASQWYTWPFMLRPIYYWNESLPGNQIDTTPARIYLLGNPAIWWGATVGIFYALLVLVISWFYRQEKPTDPKTLYLLAGAYLLNLLPFIGITRAMFLYHYFAAFIFALLLTVILIDQTTNRRKIFIGWVLASVVLFIFFAPLSYGRPIRETTYQWRAWFNSWR